MENQLVNSISVVLVGTTESRNIGFVARAMMNFGFHRLSLVAPENYNHTNAITTAVWADALIEKAKHFTTIEESVASAQDVVGFGSSAGINRPVISLTEFVNEIRNEPLKERALLFGPEDTGLTNDHVTHCRTLVRIPTSEEYPSMNLSHSVAVALYELTRELIPITNIPESTYPTSNEFYHLERIVNEVLTTSKFFREGTPEPIPRVVKNLLRRTKPNEREMGILLGMFGKIATALKRSKE